MDRRNFYCRITMESNPGTCKAFVLSQENEIVQEHYLGHGTGNLAEYVSLMYAVKESLNGAEYANIITSNQTSEIIGNIHQNKQLLS